LYVEPGAADDANTPCAATTRSDSPIVMSIRIDGPQAGEDSDEYVRRSLLFFETCRMILDMDFVGSR
jgi:hypothetical protein